MVKKAVRSLKLLNGLFPLFGHTPVVAFFVSDGSRYLTGQVLSIDGGLTMIG
jgi:NAD(P)-dependent dehydrogenase (short-subunit alcohol dehydrogenase family)